MHWCKQASFGRISDFCEHHGVNAENANMVSVEQLRWLLTPSEVFVYYTMLTLSCKMS